MSSQAFNHSFVKIKIFKVNRSKIEIIEFHRYTGISYRVSPIHRYFLQSFTDTQVFLIHYLQPVPPVVLRASSVKSQIADIEAIKFKMETKEEQIMDLKRQLKLKVKLKYLTLNPLKRKVICLCHQCRARPACTLANL